MSKVIDITDKLSFDEKPKITIKGKTVEVDDSAVAMLKVIPKIDGDVTPDDMVEIYHTIFDEKARKVIDSFKLNFKDFSEVISQAIKTITGDEDDQGEVQTPDMT